MRVLIVEDEKPLAKEVIFHLKENDWICDWAANFSEASENIAVNPYDFILLDLGLPDGDGMDLLNEISETQKNSIVIILTARSEVSDKVEALQKGADDYLPKPFSLLELQARMQAILRRKSGWNNEQVIVGEFALDINDSIVFHQDQRVHLTKKEFRILYFLLVHKNRVINRFQLAEHLWGDHIEDEYQSNFINVHIKNIRKKLGELASVDWLETVRGIGYRIKL